MLELDMVYYYHNYLTRVSDRLIEPFPRVAAGRMVYIYQLVKIWNIILWCIKNYTSVSKFNNEYTKSILKYMYTRWMFLA